MLVRHIVLSNENVRTLPVNDFRKAVETADETAFTRIAFGGRTHRGRAGVAIDLQRGVISGHKLEAIPPVLIFRVKHFDRLDVRDALRCAYAGNDILIGDETNGALLHWVGPGIEIFAAGEDSHDPL